MKYVIGLGNPGKKYENTRHNMGFFVVDRLFDGWREETKFQALMSEPNADGLVGVKPMTFMNLSGNTVSALVNFYKLDPKISSSSPTISIWNSENPLPEQSEVTAGQNGLRDIITKLGTDEFARIKIGIGRDPRYDVTDWVLSKLTQDEKKSPRGKSRRDRGKVGGWGK